MTKINELNKFISHQVIEILEMTKNNLNQSIEFIQLQNNPYLNISSVQLLNSLSKNTVESFDKILIGSEIGYVEPNYIVLTKYFEFDSLFQGTKKIPYSLLLVDKFMSIEFNEIDGKYMLIPTQYEIGENVLDVLKNLEEIITIINSNILLYGKI